jgi:purine-nucleoside phosphorylase
MQAPWNESAAAIRRQWTERPHVGIILGTGLGNVAAQFEVECELAYETIPHFPRSTALSHQGRLVCGRLRGVPAVAMAGRCHLYEGYRVEQVTLPVRVMRALGVEMLIVSNASGGLNPRFRSGEIMAIDGHLDFLSHRGLLGRGDPQDLVPAALTERGFVAAASPPGVARRTPRTECYDAELVEQSLHIARREDFVVHRGVYVAVTGPNYETRAEYRMFRQLGGDAVGMSTVPECLTAAGLGMRVLALSMITNVAIPDAPQKTEAHDVVSLAARAEPNLCKIIRGIVAEGNRPV